MKEENGYSCRFCGKAVIDFSHRCDERGVNYWVKKERRAENQK